MPWFQNDLTAAGLAQGLRHNGPAHGGETEKKAEWRWKRQRAIAAGEIFTEDLKINFTFVGKKFNLQIKNIAYTFATQAMF